MGLTGGSLGEGNGKRMRCEVEVSLGCGNSRCGRLVTDWDVG